MLKIKRILKSVCVAVLLSSVVGVTALGDEISDLKNEQSEVLSQLNGIEREIALIILEMDSLELDMADKNEQLMKTNELLEQAEEKFQKQYADMKLRIKYMYEDRDSSLADVLTASTDMAEILNKAEYIQQVYEYDRDKMAEMAETTKTIKALKNNIEADIVQINKVAYEFEQQKKLLTEKMEKLQKQYSDYDSKIANAIAKAAEEAAKRQEQMNAANKPNYNAKNDSAVANAIVQEAHKYLGVKYVYGGSTPSGFDCSGFTQYVHKQFGISLPRTAAGQLGSGQKVASLEEALPGDIICYAGHVALYIGNGQVIHAPYTGTVVRIQNADMMKILGIRRYW